MTHGRTAKASPNSRTRNRQMALARALRHRAETLKQQVIRLEIRVRELEKKVRRLSDTAPSYFYTGIHRTEKRKSGPTRNISDTELFRNRDGLVDWLENVWPQVVQPLLAAKNPQAVARLFKKVARPKDLQPPWQSRFLVHPDSVFNFLHSKKFRIKPPRKTIADALSADDNERRKRAASRLPTRQIANAMAGVPKLSWRTSLDRCSQNPCSYPVAAVTQYYYSSKY